MLLPTHELLHKDLPYYLRNNIKLKKQSEKGYSAIRCLKISVMTMLERWGVSILGRPVQRPRKENYTNNSLEMLDKEILLSLPHRKEQKYFF